MSFYIGGFGDGSCPEELSSHYNEVNNYYYPRTNSKLVVSGMYFCNEQSIRKFLLSSYFKNLVDNKTPANSLGYSNVAKGRPYFNEAYSRYDSSYVSYQKQIEWTEDLDDIKSGKCLLRFNKGENVIYTIRKTKGSEDQPEYVFRAYNLGMLEEGIKGKSVLKLFLTSQCCVEILPDVSFLRSGVKTGITTLDEVKARIPDTKVVIDGNKAYSKYACADKYGSVVKLEYEKDSKEVFRVKSIYWTAEGYNPLPYLLPIDRKLIDPNYDEAYAESEEKTVVNESGSDKKSSRCTIV